MRIIFLICFLTGLSACTYSTVGNMHREIGKRFYYASDKFLNYRTSGQGRQPLIFLHGFGASCLAWTELLPLLDESKNRCIIFDLIGFGYSSKPRDSDYSMAANADAIIKYITENHLTNYILVGHSFGGGVALLTAIKTLNGKLTQPKAIILLDAAAYNTNIPFFVSRLRIPVLGQLLLSLTSAEFQARYTLERIYFDKRKVTDDIVKKYAYFMRLPGHDYALMQAAKQIIPKDFDQYVNSYKKLNIPVLILWGQNDPVLPVSLGERLADDLPNATLQIIPECGHNIQEECPRQTANAINKFLIVIGE